MADILVRGENGIILTFSEPLHHGIAHRLGTGDLTRVNEDGTPWTGEEASEPDDAAEAAEEAPADAPPLPPKSATRAVWAEFAISQGMDREQAATMTKAQLISALTEPPAIP